MRSRNYVESIFEFYIVRLPKDIDLLDSADYRSIYLENLDLLNKWTIPVNIKPFMIMRDIELYKSQYKFLHIGMVQIAFKPLTLKGLRDFLRLYEIARNLNFKILDGFDRISRWLMVRFILMPADLLSFGDSNILDALTLNVKSAWL
ncbi:hypothetical protein H5410_035586 [Solanum commersonii]|uniref:Uncharacterized protein n=1 Tax=Solanum commersonii TaxID=4109 RepID=A0A9J5Y322_SOLCO|nr:hypothetical protein H5410_035586 [Solanum commersonii]